MGINIGSTSATGVWIGGGNNDIVREGLVFWVDSGQHKSYTGSGTTIYDMSGQGNDGTLTNSPSFGTGIIDLDGTNDYINFGDVSDYEWAYNSTYTLCAWFYLDADQNGMIMSKAIDSGNYTGWYLYFKASDNTLTHALINDSYPSRRWGNVTDDGISIGTWYYLCATYNGGDDTGKFYLNGDLWTSTRTYNSLASYSTSNAAPFSIGMRNTSSLAFNGKIPIVQMYNRLLTPSEILYNYHANRGRFGV